MQLSDGLREINPASNVSFQQQVFNIVQSITGEKNVLAVPREFIKLTGDLPSGVFLAQLVYWSDKGSRNDGFIYKTSKEWQEEIFLTDYSLRKSRNILESLGILETKTKKANGNPTVHYKLNREAFINRLFEIQQKENENTTEGNYKFNESLTETTPQTTNTHYHKHKGTASVDARTSDIKEYVKRSASTIAYYFNAYTKLKGKVHPKLKKEQIERVSEVISDFMSGFSVDEGNLESMIDKHFSRSHLKTDYNINHFAMAGILENLYYEAGLK